MEELVIDCIYTGLLPTLSKSRIMALLKDIYVVVRKLPRYSEHWVTLFTKALDYVVTNWESLGIESLYALAAEPQHRPLLEEILRHITDAVYSGLSRYPSAPISRDIMSVLKLAMISPTTNPQAPPAPSAEEKLLPLLKASRAELLQSDVGMTKTHTIELKVPAKPKRRPVIVSADCDMGNGTVVLQLSVEGNEKKSGEKVMERPGGMYQETEQFVLKAKLVENAPGRPRGEEALADKYYGFLVRTNKVLDYNRTAGSESKRKVSPSLSGKKRMSQQFVCSKPTTAPIQNFVFGYRCEIYLGASQASIVSDFVPIHAASRPVVLCNFSSVSGNVRVRVVEHKIYNIALNFVKQKFVLQELKGILMLTYSEIKGIVASCRVHAATGLKPVLPESGYRNLLAWIDLHIKDLTGVQIEALLKMASSDPPSHGSSPHHHTKSGLPPQPAARRPSFSPSPRRKLGARSPPTAEPLEETKRKDVELRILDSMLESPPPRHVLRRSCTRPEPGTQSSAQFPRYLVLSGSAAGSVSGVNLKKTCNEGNRSHRDLIRKSSKFLDELIKNPSTKVLKSKMIAPNS